MSGHGARTAIASQGIQSSSNPRKYIVHNYGHGGAGITLSWGVASQVRDLVRNRAQVTGDTTVAVLGSGVMGLTAATLILELGLKVTVYAKEFWKDTTSHVAGGQWAPSSVKYSNESMFKDALKIAYDRFARDIGQGFVSKKVNYTPRPDPYLDIVVSLVPGLIPAPVPMNLPFEHLTSPGFMYQTLLIETPKFLEKLDRDLRQENVPFKHKTFTNVASVLGLQENLIVNCTGLGAKDIWGDTKLAPIKGHLALLKHQPRLTYLFSRAGQVFPRGDFTIIGGTNRFGDATTNPEPDVSRGLVAYMNGGVRRRASSAHTHVSHRSSGQSAICSNGKSSDT